MSRKTRQLIRSVLFCPTDKISLIEKALGIGKNSSLYGIADVVVLDLEDSVSPTMKERARDNIIQVMNNISEYSDQRRLPKIVVRINCALTTEWGIEDLKLTTKVNADAILIPKVNNSFDLQHTLSLRQSSRTIPIWAMVETSKGVLNAPTIADVLNIEALVFGSNDLTKDLKSFSVKDRMPLMYSMSHCILAARAAGKQVVDGVFMDIKDDDGFREECMAGKNLGFDGKSLIHPNQVQICNEVFSPSPTELQHARRVVEAFVCAQAQGKGVAVLDNKLVEHLHYLQAKDLIHRSESICMP